MVGRRPVVAGIVGASGSLSVGRCVACQRALACKLAGGQTARQVSRVFNGDSIRRMGNISGHVFFHVLTFGRHLASANVFQPACKRRQPGQAQGARWLLAIELSAR